jgi:hypothetical protein
VKFIVKKKKKQKKGGLNSIYFIKRCNANFKGNHTFLQLSHFDYLGSTHDNKVSNAYGQRGRYYKHGYTELFSKNYYL